MGKFETITERCSFGIGHRNTVVKSHERKVIAEFDDVEGAYQTTVGEIGVTFGSRTITLDIGKAKALQTHNKRKERRIEIDRYGKGEAMIARKQVLYVTTDRFEKR